MNPLNEALIDLEADLLWGLENGTVGALCRQGHIEARRSAGFCAPCRKRHKKAKKMFTGHWLTTRAAMTARYGPQPSEFMPEDERQEWQKTHPDLSDLGLEARG